MCSPSAVHPGLQQKAAAFIIGQCHILQNSQGGACTGSRILKNTADKFAAPMFLHFCNLTVFEKNLSGISWQTAAQQVENRRFSGTVAAHNGNKTPLLNLQVKILKQNNFVNRTGIKSFIDMFHAHHWFRLWCG